MVAMGSVARALPSRPQTCRLNIFIVQAGNPRLRDLKAACLGSVTVAADAADDPYPLSAVASFGDAPRPTCPVEKEHSRRRRLTRYPSEERAMKWTEGDDHRQQIGLRLSRNHGRRTRTRQANTRGRTPRARRARRPGNRAHRKSARSADQHEEGQERSAGTAEFPTSGVVCNAISQSAPRRQGPNDGPIAPQEQHGAGM